MGDRSTIVIQDRDHKRVYLYGHWMGPSAIDHVGVGLVSNRVGDSGYLARIIFSSMIKHEVASEFGFAISASPVWSEYPLIVIDGDHAGGAVWLELESGEPITPKVSAAAFLDAASRMSTIRFTQEDADEYGSEFAQLITAIGKV